MTQPPQTFDGWLADQILSLHGKVDKLMTQADDLNAGMAQLSTDLAAVATSIETEIKQLADVIGVGLGLEAAATAAVQGLSAAHQQLTTLQSNLAADDPAAPPAP